MKTRLTSAIAALAMLSMAFLSAPAHAGSTTSELSAPEMTGYYVDIPIAASTKLYQGAMIALNSSGYAVTATDTAGQRVIGRCEATVDNSSGSAGDKHVRVKRGTFAYANSGTNAITQAYVGKFAYVEDDHTVATTATNKTKAGRVVKIETTPTGKAIVWVDFALHFQAIPTVVTLTQDTLTDNSGGSASTTIASISDTATKNAIASIVAQLAKIKTDLAAVLAADQTAGTIK